MGTMSRNIPPRYLATQIIDYTSTSASTAAAFDTQTRMIRIAANSAANYRIFDGTASSTCTSNDPMLPSTWVVDVGVTPGQKVSAIKASGGSVTSADGRMWITELA